MSKLVLVVDDERDILEIVSLSVEKDGLRVEFAKNGAVAVEKIASLKPDLMVLDLMLPMMSGLDILKQMQKSGSKIPVIVLTAISEVSPGRKEAGTYPNVVSVLGKPIQPGELRKRILAALGGPEGKPA